MGDDVTPENALAIKGLQTWPRKIPLPVATVTFEAANRDGVRVEVDARDGRSILVVFYRLDVELAKALESAGFVRQMNYSTAWRWRDLPNITRGSWVVMNRNGQLEALDQSDKGAYIVGRAAEDVRSDGRVFVAIDSPKMVRSAAGHVGWSQGFDLIELDAGTGKPTR